MGLNTWEKAQLRVESTTLRRGSQVETYLGVLLWASGVRVRSWGFGGVSSRREAAMLALLIWGP